MSRSLRLVAPLALAGLLAACDTGDGTTLDPPPTTAAIQVTPAAEQPVELSGDTFELASPVMSELGNLPDRYDGSPETDLSPSFEWAGVPEGTAQLALVATDVTDGATIRWLVADIDPAQTRLEEGFVPPGAVQPVNDYGEAGWTGPLSDDVVTTITFELLALSEPVLVDADARAADVLLQLRAVTTATATLSVLHE